MVTTEVDLLLALWSRRGDDAASARTYQRIKAAIESHDALREREVEVYLQGSYANSTNIHDDSDVDIVVQSSASFYPGFDDNLTALDRKDIASEFSAAEYKYAMFRDDVGRALRNSFPRLVQEGNKALKVKAVSGLDRTPFASPPLMRVQRVAEPPSARRRQPGRASPGCCAGASCCTRSASPRAAPAPRAGCRTARRPGTRRATGR